MTRKSGSAVSVSVHSEAGAPAPSSGKPKPAACKPRPEIERQDSEPTQPSGFPIIGIGASAGGLEALELFLAEMPPVSDLALIIVQHLDPTHKDLMVELLQRKSTLPVVQITDRMRVQPNHVYVLPPNQDLSILHGVLHLLQPTGVRGLRLPIDFFFNALADDQQQRSIGVILSGMGSDGTKGARAIKEKGGAVFAQSSAKYDGMPRSVMDAGLVDGIAPAEALAAKIIDYIHHVPLLNAQPGLDLLDSDQSGLEKIILILRSRTGHDFTFYKKSTLYRRIERRMALHQLSKIADYVRYLRENPQESDLLFRELLIGVTHFFRDPLVWEQLQSEALPALLAAHPNGGMLRAWCPGCSTGEEPYSLAILFREVLEQVKPAAHFTLQIFATDLDKDAIDKARTGSYSIGGTEGISETRLRRFFEEDGRGFRVSKEIREMVIFAPQNLVMDPPFTKLDLLVCRNLLIYLEASLQKRLLPLFHYSLNPSGLLVMGSSETVGQAADLFVPLPGKTRIFRRKEATLRADQVEFPSSFASIPTRDNPRLARITLPMASPSALNLQALTDALLLQSYAPAAVLTTASGDILYFSGKTGKYLEPAAGKANLNVFAMAREGLSGALNEAFSKAVRQNTSVTLKGVKVGTNGSTLCVDVTVQALDQPVALHGMVLIVFTDVATPASTKATGKAGQPDPHAARLTALSMELQQSRDEMQSAREEMQSSQEELKSANEELQSTNEELQSTNEELTTSKEEMQSMNEELQTINHELQAKVNELSQSKDDMSNLLNSIEIATLFLDDSLKVRRFTPQTTDIIKLIPGDAGRPITDLATDLDYPSLAEDAREVLRLLTPHEQQAPTRDGHWFTVRIMPYRTHDNRIDGVVITFLDITASKALEGSLREALSALKRPFPNQDEAPIRIDVLETTLRKAEANLKAQFGEKSKDLLTGE